MTSTKKKTPQRKHEIKEMNRTMGKAQAEIEMWKELYKKKYKINPELLSEKYVEKLGELQELKENYDNLNTWYIVVNPNPKLMEGDILTEFLEKCKDVRYKKWIHTCKLWFEWRKEDMTTIHANFAITKSKYPLSRVKNEFFNSFKKFIGNIEHINIQRVRDSQFQHICEYQWAEKKLKLDPIMRDIIKVRDSYWTVKGIEDLNKL